MFSVVVDAVVIVNVLISGAPLCLRKIPKLVPLNPKKNPSAASPMPMVWVEFATPVVNSAVNLALTPIPALYFTRVTDCAAPELFAAAPDWQTIILSASVTVPDWFAIDVTWYLLGVVP
jgi:hypothetical protein